LATVDLSAFYVDVTKDRMYTLGAKSHERRSTQTVMYLISEGLARLLAPLLPVTADQLWQHIPGRRSESIHLEEFPKVEAYTDAPLLKRWEALLNVRDQVNAALEEKRKETVIGTSLGARDVINAAGPIGALLKTRCADLPMLFNVSDVELTVRDNGGSTEQEPAHAPVRVEVEKAPGVKCARCWRFVTSVRTDPDCAGICDRCVDALAGLVNC
jgi:isoleucyl-tRNA synthetase